MLNQTWLKLTPTAAAVLGFSLSIPTARRTEARGRIHCPGGVTFQCRKSTGKGFKSPAQLFSFSKGWKMDVLIFQGWAEPLAEALVLELYPLGDITKALYFPRIAAMLKTRRIILSDVTWRKNVEHVAVMSKTSVLWWWSYK